MSSDNTSQSDNEKSRLVEELKILFSSETVNDCCKNNFLNIFGCWPVPGSSTSTQTFDNFVEEHHAVNFQQKDCVNFTEETFQIIEEIKKSDLFTLQDHANIALAMRGLLLERAISRCKDLTFGEVLRPVPTFATTRVRLEGFKREFGEMSILIENGTLLPEMMSITRQKTPNFEKLRQLKKNIKNIDSSSVRWLNNMEKTMVLFIALPRAVENFYKKIREGSYRYVVDHDEIFCSCEICLIVRKENLELISGPILLEEKKFCSLSLDPKYYQ